jgi:hypothetical protein
MGTGRNWSDQYGPRVVEQDKTYQHRIVMFCSFVIFSIEV